jgi:hypothetical protein
MKSLYIPENIVYTGEQLRSNFAYRTCGILGDSIIAFSGKCDIQKEHMVDIEDLIAGNIIFSESMLHFIIEHFKADLEHAVLRQMLFAGIAKDAINTAVKKCVVRCEGSDLYDDDAKVSISVATRTPVSAIIHFGINITSDNTPVLTKGLKDYGIELVGFAKTVLDAYVNLNDIVQKARCKVRWVW